MPTRKRSTGKKKSLKSKRKSSVLRNEKKENSLALQEGNLFDSEVGKTDALFINSPIDIDLNPPIKPAEPPKKPLWKRFFHIDNKFFSILIGLIFSGIFCAGMYVLATYGSDEYYPAGNTLNPSCNPGDTYCKVAAPLTNSFTANFSGSGNFSTTGDVGVGAAVLGGTKLYVYSTSNGGGMTIDGNSNPGISLATNVSGGAVKAYVGVPTSAGSWLSTSAISDMILRSQGSNILFGFGTDEKVRITSTGNVGIGTTSPGAKLHIKGSSVGAANIRLNFTAASGRTYELNPYRTSVSNAGFEIRDVTAGTSRVSIDENGNVGIGTTAPFSLFQVQSPTGVSTLTSSYIANIWGSYNADRGNLVLGTTDAAAADKGGILSFSGETGQAVTPYYFANIKGAKESGGTYNGYLAFSTVATSSVMTERMRINSSGDVGIGTIAPRVDTNYDIALTISSGVASSGRKALLELQGSRGALSSLSAGIDFYNYSVGGNFLLSNIASYTGSAAFDSGILVLRTANAGVLTERMRIDENGNVGIGTTSPSALLSVGSGSIFQVDSSGNMSTTGNISLDNQIIDYINGSASGSTYSATGSWYMGRDKITQNQLTLDDSTVGATWTERDSHRNWLSVDMSSDGKYQSAVASGIDQVYISSNYGATWAAVGNSASHSDIAVSSDGKYQTTTSDYIYISSNYGNTWTAKGSSLVWIGVAMSSDGKYQTATTYGNQIYISSDYGNTWTAKGDSLNWMKIAMSSDGKYQTTVVDADGQIYISSDYGNTWTAKGSALDWNDVAMSSDGKYQTAVANSDFIYVSSDYGATWTAKGSDKSWYGVAMSSDGKYQSAAIGATDYVYVSYDYGATWTAKGSELNWYGVAMSSDGKIQTAVAYGDHIYTSYNTSSTYGDLQIYGDVWYATAHSGFGDVAEDYPTNDTTLSAGEIVGLDKEKSMYIIRADASDTLNVIGIISTAPGMELGADKQYSKEKKVPVALAGRVPVKVDLEGGPINIGDRITLSLRNPGVGMKASAGDNTIGIALQSFSGLENGISTSVDSILVFVQNQQTRIDSSGAMGDGEISGLTPASILNSLSSLQADLMSGMVALKQLVLDRITVGVARVNKLEMVDSLSGDIYCTWMENGEWKKAKGECVVDMVAINTASQSSVSNREVMSLQRQVDQLQEQNNQQDEQIQEVQEQVQEQVEQQPQSLNIVSVAALTEKEVPYGTETELLDLPTNVQVAFSDNSQHNLSVIWDSGTPVYDKNTPGVYTFSGTLIFSGNITNNNNVSVVLNITVAQDINVTTGEIINDAGANLLTGAINFVKWLFGPDSKSSTIKKVSADLIDGFAFVQSWIFEEMQYLQHGVGALLKPFENFLKID